MTLNLNCPLCLSLSDEYCSCSDRSYYSCPNCKGIFLSPDDQLSIEAEIERYKLHNNNVDDQRYQKFVSPIVEAVPKLHKPGSLGLDFGCGTGPVITMMLASRGYDVKIFDPYFAYFPEVLNGTYDFIICCEVIEHFRNPALEFKKLRSMLKNSGNLFFMTDLYSNEINFSNWYYKNDPTHVFFYTKDTMNWIKEAFDFRKVSIKDRLITYLC